MNNSLINLYIDRFDLQNATFFRIDHHEGLVAIVYKITPSNGTPLILKICERAEDYLREMFFLNHFTHLPVPKIIASIEPEKGINGAILMEYLPGELLTARDLTETMAFEIGVTLANIHLNPVSGYGDLTQPKELSRDPRVYFVRKYEEGFIECSGHLPSTLMNRCREYYNAHLDLLDSVDGPCMIHRDFRPGNIIIFNGKLKGIIDWASARASFAEEDFCPLEHHEWLLNVSNKASFLKGYASIRPIPQYQKIMPLLRLSRALAIIGFTIKRKIWKSSGARTYEFNRFYLENLLDSNGKSTY